MACPGGCFFRLPARVPSRYSLAQLLVGVVGFSSSPPERVALLSLALVAVFLPSDALSTQELCFFLNFHQTPHRCRCQCRGRLASSPYCSPPPSPPSPPPWEAPPRLPRRPPLPRPSCPHSRPPRPPEPVTRRRLRRLRARLGRTWPCPRAGARGRASSTTRWCRCVHTREGKREKGGKTER